MSQNISSLLENLFQISTKKSFDLLDPVEITQSTKDNFGDYQCNSALKFAKQLGKNPREVAADLIKNLQDESKIIEKLEIAGPGFINIHLNKTFLENELTRIAKDERLGVEPLKKKEKIICEFSSPNIAKAMHVGHLRSTIIGDSLARLFEFLGHDVLRLNHVGDWGTQFGMLIAYLKMFEPKVLDATEETNIEDLMKWYKASKLKFDESLDFKKTAQEEVVKLQSGDKESLNAWKLICDISRKGFKEIYDLLDVHIEERGESFYNPYLKEVVSTFEKLGLVKVDDGAKCVFLEGFQNKEGDLLPLMIQKSDGGFNYATTDLAGFEYRIHHDKADRIIIVTDIGQSMHFKMVYEALKKAQLIDPTKVRFDHVPFGLVLSAEGKKFKTREGETVRLSDLLNESIEEAKLLLKGREVENLDESAKILGIGAVKYADLSCNRIKDYTFSYERMLKFEGNTVAFILYAYVRIESIKRKLNKDFSTFNIKLTHPSEITLALHLRRFGEALKAMDEELLPNRLTDYLYHLAEKFHSFFRDCQVLGSEEEESRLQICILTQKIIERGLFILGIKTLTKM
jgi:arginyl-tRNA synthetase